jgi:hypothetical protein
LRLPKAVGIAIVALGTGFATNSAAEIDSQALDSLLAQADKIVVLEGWERASNVLFSSTDSEDIEEFRKAVAVDPSQGQFYCACVGTPVIRLYHRGEEILTVSNHHGRSIRNSLWTNNVPLKNLNAWVEWFDTRGIPGPKDELEESIRRTKEAEVAKQRWLQGMPPSVVPLWSQIDLNSRSVDLDPFRQVLADAYPNRYVRILVLLEWYGSGAGPWSGFPLYEDHVLNLLLDFSTPELLTAIEGTVLTDRQMEGAARLFGEWTFNRKRPADRELIPEQLKSDLLEHALRSDDQDKRSRALAAFQGD